jgi:2-polyprenyl-3-methyl-5-hydroxy-6-metoxy-1,4-benzoquinol methylase
LKRVSVDHQPETRDGSSLTSAYADRLELRQVSAWRRRLGVQLPYRWNLRRLKPGFVLDLGCGVGRNLGHLDGAGIGVDPNPACVEAARHLGFRAYTPDEFDRRCGAEAWRFDSILVAHVLEHVGLADSVGLVRKYVQHVKHGGQLILITPQEAGYRSDPTHVEFMDDRKLHQLCAALDLPVQRSYSFPFPRRAGRYFTYNEFVVVAKVDRRG